jgi:OmpA-OmpF porin, OOP family
MPAIPQRSKTSFLLATLAVIAPGSLCAQQVAPDGSDIVVTGQPEVPVPDANAAMPIAPASKGPEIKGIISARSGDRLQITTADGNRSIISFNEATQIRSNGSFLGIGRGKLTGASLLNGLPVTVKTLQSGDALMASKITLRNGDLKTANMIHSGTAQGFAEQTAATQALRGRMGDIDEYNIKSTTNVNFATGKAALTEQGKAELCATANAASGVKNALLLVAGHTDSTGSDDLNQKLSEKRASSVVNHLQQACGWKPYRMLTPAGLSKSDPVADNTSAVGKAQNRRVEVKILVSKGLDGL